MTATTKPVQISPQQLAQLFLKYARTYPGVVQIGTLAGGAGVAGGATNTLVWNKDVPVAPSWAEAIVLQVTVPFSITLPANSTATISPFFPWCLFAHNLVLGGAPPFASPISGVPFWLDEITSRHEAYDPSDNDPTDIASAWRNNAGNNGAGNPLNSAAFNLGGLTPGGTVVNSGTAAVTNNYTVTFRLRINLGRSWHNRQAPNLFGFVPLGDPMNRPRLDMYLNPIVGTHPEDNAIQDVGAKGITANITTGQSASVTAVWESKSLDILPPGVSVPSPLVGMGLAVNTNPQAIQNAGQIQQVQHRAAMLYEKTFHLLINNQQAVDADYFGLWVTGEEQSARWEYDNNQANMWKYYDDVHRRYGRYLPNGVFVADYVGGEDPGSPYETEYDGLMTPDVTYAGMAGIAATPAMYTALRVPNGVAMSGAYVRTYSFGLVSVPY